MAGAKDAKPEKRRRPRRSAGCEACKARRMKCTQEKPVCRECEKRGLAHLCVYGTDLIIFQSENSKIESQYRVTGTKRRYLRQGGEGIGSHFIKKLKCKVETPETMSSNQSGPPSPTMTEASTSVVDIEMESPTTIVRKQYLCDDEILPGKGYSSWTQTPHYHLVTLEESALSSFFNDFLPSEKFIQNHQPWSRGLKALLHQNDMVRNVILAIARRHVKDSYTSGSVDARYNKALATQNYHHSVLALQHSIEDPVRVRQDETIVAVSLLALFELMCGNSSSFQYHLDGMFQLLKLRGSEGFTATTDPLTLLTFSAFQAEDIRQSILNGRSTFLASPEWQAAARRCLSPTPSNRFAGSDLNILMLELTEVCARDRLNITKAYTLRDAFLRERAATLPVANVVSAHQLEHVSERAKLIKLTESPFGPDCISYDPLFNGSYDDCVRAVMIDWALLNLRITYPELASDGDYAIMVEIMQVVQYIFHDRGNFVISVISDTFAPIGLCLEFAKTDAETDWILHFLNVTGVAAANKLGRIAKERVRDFNDTPALQARSSKIYGKFLEGAGMTTPAIEAAALAEEVEELLDESNEPPVDQAEFAAAASGIGTPQDGSSRSFSPQQGFTDFQAMQQRPTLIGPQQPHMSMH